MQTENKCSKWELCGSWIKILSLIGQFWKLHVRIPQPWKVGCHSLRIHEAKVWTLLFLSLFKASLIKIQKRSHHLLKDLLQLKRFKLEEILQELYQACLLEIKMDVVSLRVLLHIDWSTFEANCDSKYDHQKIEFLKEQIVLLRELRQGRIWKAHLVFKHFCKYKEMLMKQQDWRQLNHQQ